jgi:hypothetical protein
MTEMTNHVVCDRPLTTDNGPAAGYWLLATGYSPLSYWFSSR